MWSKDLSSPPMQFLRSSSKCFVHGELIKISLQIVFLRGCWEPVFRTSSVENPGKYTKNPLFPILLIRCRWRDIGTYFFFSRWSSILKYQIHGAYKLETKVFFLAFDLFHRDAPARPIHLRHGLFEFSKEIPNMHNVFQIFTTFPDYKRLGGDALHTCLLPTSTDSDKLKKLAVLDTGVLVLSTFFCARNG